MAKKIIPESSYIISEEGVDYLKEHCVLNGLEFKLATQEEDLKYGIDCYVDNIATDVKNTDAIYFLQIFLIDGIINVRHPFKKNTKAVQLAQCKKDKNKQIADIKIIPINDLLLINYFRSQDLLNEFKEYLQDLDRKEYKATKAVSIAQFLFLTKEYIQNTFLKDNVKIYYNNVAEATDEISMKMVVGTSGPIKEKVILHKGLKPIQETIIKIIID